MITIIHASRNRPQLAIATAKKWIDRIGLPQDEFEYVMSLDSDDPELWNYSNKFPCLNFTRLINENKSAVEAINVAAEFYSKHRGKPRDFLIVISDDFDCFEGWGSYLISLMQEKKDWILKTYDGIQDWVITLPIMDWDYYNRFGYVYHPDYQHCFCDTEMTCVAELIRRLHTNPASPSNYFYHDHYSTRGLQKDFLYERNDATFESGKKIFIERKKRNFDIKPANIIGYMTDNVYTRMQ